jgi:hypothetical protein
MPIPEDPRPRISRAATRRAPIQLAAFAIGHFANIVGALAIAHHAVADGGGSPDAPGLSVLGRSLSAPWSV